MKKIIITLILSIVMQPLIQAQEIKTTPSVSVTGNGEIKIAPDKAIITLGVENTGKNATIVKQENDQVIANVIKVITKHKIKKKDFQTQRVSLHKNYDYKKKIHQYVANQTLVINVKDLAIYNALMVDLVATGINTIQGVSFQSSELEKHQSLARKKAMENAVNKANDYVSVLHQSIGKALHISDNSSIHNPQPIYRNYALSEAKMMSDTATSTETLAIGEITVKAKVTVTFKLN